VVARPGTTLEAAAARTPALRARLCRPDQVGDSATHVVFVDADTRAISSTLVRTRLAARQPIDDLVPAAVARHIVRHHLYGAVGDLHGENTSG
jgi:nicotinic acid mononucleotide adenylyltransferase